MDVKLNFGSWVAVTQTKLSNSRSLNSETCQYTWKYLNLESLTQIIKNIPFTRWAKCTLMPRTISGITPACWQVIPKISEIEAPSLGSLTPNTKLSFFPFFSGLGKLVSRKRLRSSESTPNLLNDTIVTIGQGKKIKKYQLPSEIELMLSSACAADLKGANATNLTTPLKRLKSVTDCSTWGRKDPTSSNSLTRNNA